MEDEKKRYAMLIRLCAYYNYPMNLEGTDLLNPRVEAAKQFFLKVPIDKIDMLYDKIIKRDGESAPFFPMYHEIAEIYHNIVILNTRLDLQPLRIGRDPELTEENVYKKFIEDNKISMNCPDGKLTNEQFYADYEKLPFYVVLKKYGFRRCYDLIMNIEISDEEWEKRRRKRKVEIIQESRDSRQQFIKSKKGEIKNPDWFHDI